VPPTAIITCEFTFEASHRLSRPDWSEQQNWDVFGNCSRLHGHSYRLLVSLRGRVDPETGMVRNFRDVKRIVREEVLSRLDHHHLEDVMTSLTTAENICCWIAGRLIVPIGEELHRVELWETITSCAVLTREELAEIEPAAQAGMPGLDSEPLEDRRPAVPAQGA